MIRPTYVLLSALALPAIAAGVNPISKALEASGTSRERISKQAALTGITRGVLLPGYAELTASCAALAKAADELHASPSVTSLKKTQEAWVTALLAWRRTQSFVRGPVTDLNVYGRLQFWPLRPDSVDRVLRDKRPIDATYVEALGANAVGLFPLEKLLFDPAHDAALLAVFTGPQGERRRTTCAHWPTNWKRKPGSRKTRGRDPLATVRSSKPVDRRRSQCPASAGLLRGPPEGGHDTDLKDALC